MKNANTRVLVIDDEELVRDNIEEILIPHKYASMEDDSMLMASSILFDMPQQVLLPRTSNLPLFTVDKATNGKEGLMYVRESLANNTPYAVIFLDMRMPGWDGLETAMQIRRYDAKAEIIFITAYSDRSIEEIIDKAGQNVGYHCKPYASEEIIQLATKAITDYSRMRNLEHLIHSVSSIGLSNKYHLASLLQNILYQIASSVDTDMAVLGKVDNHFRYEKIISIGAIEEQINLDLLKDRIEKAQLQNEEIVQFDDMVLARMSNYTVFALLKNGGKLKTEKMYLLKLFIQNAAQAIINAELAETLLQKEKLSAVGKAIGMVMHDLRSPINGMMVITEMMREENPDTDWIDIIESYAKQASEIFEDFLAFIREAPMNKEPVNVSRMLAEVIRSVSVSSNEKGIKIEEQCSGNLMINGDESKLKRSFMNIINNAVNVLENRRVKDGCIRVHAEEDAANGEIKISIRDNGPGIPADIIHTLFEPFVTKETANGTGLGLAIVKQFITAHDGTVEVHNDDGAVFTICLPK